LSRNYRVGYAIGQGKSVEQAVAELGQTAEGVNTVRLVAEKAEQLGVYMPIASGLYQILFRGKPMQAVIKALMGGEHNHDVEFVVTGEQ
jgi:glycerol-3-phosphate dehydrogenase (NAD(P)+)